MKQYNNLQVVRLLQDKVGKMWKRFVFKGEWNTQTAGGCTSFPTWHENPQYSIVTKGRTKIFVDLSQPDARLQWLKEYKNPIGIYIFKTKGNLIKKQDAGNLVQYCEILNSQNGETLKLAIKKS